MRKPVNSRLQSSLSRRLCLEPLESRNLLAVFSVTNLNDSGTGSLRHAVGRANTLAGPDEVVFESGVAGTIRLVSGQIDINDSLRISGPGPDELIIDAGGNSRIFDATSGFTLEGMTLENGRTDEDGGAIRHVSRFDMTIRDSVISGNSAPDGEGGGIFSRSPCNCSSLEIDNSVVDENIARFRGGGIRAHELVLRNSAITGNRNTEADFFDSRGGGVYARNLDVHDSLVSANWSEGSAGGMWGRTVSIAGSIVSNNTGGDVGGIGGGSVLLQNSVTIGNSGGRTGGISASGVWISDSSIRDNHGERTGGVASLVTTVENSTISGNSGTSIGGGLTGFHMNVANSTIADNISPMGGGIHGNGSINVRNSTITNNTGGLWAESTSNTTSVVMVENSIVAGNSRNVADYVTDIGTSSDAFLFVTWSLIGDATDSGLIESQTPDADGNLIGDAAGNGIIDPMLDALADNGGFRLPDGTAIRTHALKQGSPAIDMGDPVAEAGVLGMPETDQRGLAFTRVANGRLDLGAFELQSTNVDADFNDDGQIDCQDIDSLVGQILSGANNPLYDLSGDGLVTLEDQEAWLSDAGEANLGPGKSYLHGDATLDGGVDIADFNIWNRNKFSILTVIPGWCDGNFNGDAFVDVSDFAIWNASKFTASDAAGSTEDFDRFSGASVTVASFDLSNIANYQRPNRRHLTSIFQDLS